MLGGRATRSNSKKIRENLNRLPREVEATLPSWVKCTDPIPREILEEVRSTVLVWMKNVKNYVEEAETYILNDEHTHQEIVDDGWAFYVLSYLCRDPLLFCPFPNTGIPSPPSYDVYDKFYAEGLDSHEREKLLRIYNPVNPTTNLPYSFVHNASKTKVVHTGWPRFIRRMILSDVNIEHYEGEPGSDITNIVVGSREEMFRVFDNEYTVQPPPVGVSLTVTFHDRLSSKIKDEISSKLASALRALKSRISRICGINELERRTQSH